MAALESLAQRFEAQVVFLIVYIKEAHLRAQVQLPAGTQERPQAARLCATELGTGIPILIDGKDDNVARSYGGWPDRLYLISRQGLVVFQGRDGPDGCRADELERAIVAELGVAGDSGSSPTAEESR